MGIYIGTAGWTYPQGAGKWDGIFYPERMEDRDKLAYYAERFNAVEVNSSFYRPMNPHVARTWVERTPSDFRFCAKLWNKFTHPKMHAEAKGQQETVTEADYETIRQGIEPLAESGRLGALMAQFPTSFKAEDGSVEYLEELLGRLADFPLAVELRHRSWNEREDVRRLFEDRGVAWVMIDEPKFKTSIRDIPLTSRLGYFRFHGRNYQEWWKGDRETRYNYLYTPPEQAALAGDVQEVAERTADTYVFYNNHYKAKAVVNGLQLRAQLGQPVGPDFNEELLKEYPDLKDLVGVGSKVEGRG
jgi:uncharacterized protein YecE (DUF72 family)